MLFPVALLGLFCCLALFMALKPAAYSKYFLAEFQRRQSERDPDTFFKAISVVGWIMFGVFLLVLIGIAAHAGISRALPYLEVLFFLGCGIAYIWWGIGLFRRPELFLRHTPPFDRLPLVAVKVLGVLLGIGAAEFLYGFVKRLIIILR
jgi:amino acid transporter